MEGRVAGVEQTVQLTAAPARTTSMRMSRTAAIRRKVASDTDPGDRARRGRRATERRRRAPRRLPAASRRRSRTARNAAPSRMSCIATTVTTVADPALIGDRAAGLAYGNRIPSGAWLSEAQPPSTRMRLAGHERGIGSGHEADRGGDLRGSRETVARGAQQASAPRRTRPRQPAGHRPRSRGDPRPRDSPGSPRAASSIAIARVRPSSPPIATADTDRPG